MPQQACSDKRERRYEHVKDSQQERGVGEYRVGRAGLVPASGSGIATAVSTSASPTASRAGRVSPAGRAARPEVTTVRPAVIASHAGCPTWPEGGSVSGSTVGRRPSVATSQADVRSPALRWTAENGMSERSVERAASVRLLRIGGLRDLAQLAQPRSPSTRRRPGDGGEHPWQHVRRRPGWGCRSRWSRALQIAEARVVDQPSTGPSGASAPVTPPVVRWSVPPRTACGVHALPADGPAGSQSSSSPARCRPRSRPCW